MVTLKILDELWLKMRNEDKLHHCTMGCLRSLMTPYQNNPRIRYGAITNDSVSAKEQWQMTPCSLRSNYDSVSNDLWFPF